MSAVSSRAPTTAYFNDNVGLDYIYFTYIYYLPV
nr:MAG TPA: hypothetical protein [Caudoviricetes sp.]